MADPNDTTNDYVEPAALVAAMTKKGVAKAALGTRDLLLRGVMSGMLLGFATAVSFTMVAEGSPGWVGALAFPLGFVILMLLGYELVTGNFALLPTALFAGKIDARAVARNWAWVFLGNLAGSVVFAGLLYAAVTKFGHQDGGELGRVLVARATAKTLAYQQAGAAVGLSTAFVKALLCNWMVATGTVMSLVSRSVAGKTVAMWLPIFAFFALGLEHSVVNMFLIPAGILFGGAMTIADWWLWNQLIVTLGNIVGAAGLVGFVLHRTWGEPAR